MDKHIKELEFKGDVEELLVEMQATMNSILVDFNKEIQAFQALDAAREGKLQVFKAEIEAYKVEVEGYKVRIEALEA